MPVQLARLMMALKLASLGQGASGVRLAAFPDRPAPLSGAGVPEVSRFNAGQKFVFWTMALLVPVLFFTGLAIWEVYFGSFTSIETQRVAVLIHGLAAAGAIIVWVVHVYAALWVKGSIRAMTCIPREPLVFGHPRRPSSSRSCPKPSSMTSTSSTTAKPPQQCITKAK